MRESRIHYNFQLPKAYDRVIWHIYALLQKDPTSIGKMKGYIIKKTDIFKFMFDLIADHFELDLKVKNGFTIEIVNPQKKKNNNIDETNLCRILSSMDFKILEEYLHSDEGFQEKMTIFEFCDMKGIDWVSLLKEDKK